VVGDSDAQTFGGGPRFRTAAQLVRDGTFPVSEAVLQSHAREHGIGKMMGRTRIFSVEDTVRLYEVLPTCRSSWSNAQNRRTGSSVAQSGESALRKARELLIKNAPKRSRSSEKGNYSRN
jgi:hypothetical protein